MKTFRLLYLGLLLAFVASARADQIEMLNGDRYHGNVLAMTNAKLILQSDILGTLTLPREKVSQILLGNVAVTNATRMLPPKSAVKAQNKPALVATNLFSATNSPTSAEAAEQK